MNDKVFQTAYFLSKMLLELFVAKESETTWTVTGVLLIALEPRPRQCPLEMLGATGWPGALKCSGSPSAHRAALLTEGPQECRTSGSWPSGPPILQTLRRGATARGQPLAQDTAPRPLRGFRTCFHPLTPDSPSETAPQQPTRSPLYGCKVTRFIYSQTGSRRETRPSVWARVSQEDVLLPKRQQLTEGNPKGNCLSASRVHGTLTCGPGVSFP